MKVKKILIYSVLLLVLGLQSCGINSDLMLKTPKDYTFSEMDIDSANATKNEYIINVNDIIKRKTQFKKLLEPYLSKYCKEMLNDFREYWQEKSPAGKKMRFEMTKNQPFDPARRLSTWNKKSKNDKPNKINNKTIPTDEQYNEFFNDVNKKEDGKN